ncbi:MAG TPA: efflux RND transporter periplasmic adaptor subunit [Opitutus sp.]|nr:efflux RND transporter periplasmic adaptor subunit [Opitutus sp.]
MSSHPPASDRSFALRPRIVAIVVASLSAVVAAIGYFSSHAAAAESASGPAAAPPAPKVTVAPVEEKLVTDYEEITGHVDATETVELRARVSGHLETVHFQAGALVKKGDVLFTIDPRWYRAHFDLARAQASEARAHAEIAEREAQRTDALLAAAAISHEEAEERRARAVEAKAAYASAQAALETAQLDLDHTEVRAPIDGRISRALVTTGNLVSGTPGNATLLTTIVSVGPAYVYADIDESTLLKFNRLIRESRIALDHGRVPVEMQLEDETGYPRRGYIESTDNRLNPDTGSLVVRLVFPNTDNALVPGLFARVRIPISAPQRALLISDLAIGTDQSQKFVLALASDNTAAYRTVELGGSFHDKRVVRSGLHAGDRVIVNGLQRVRPGMVVDPEVAVATNPSASSSATTVAIR